MDKIESINEFRRRVRARAVEVFESTSPTQWPIDAFEIMLGAYGWMGFIHNDFMDEVKMDEPTRTWWQNRLLELMDIINKTEE